MLNKIFFTLLLLLSVVRSATTTTCNPLSATCSADKALATAYEEDFTTNSTYFEEYHTPDRIAFTDEGLKLTLAKQYDNPSLVSKEYIMYGRVEALVKAANGTGVISTIYLQSDVGDEIDYEWFGGDASQVATDFFRKANTSTYDRGTYYDMADPRSSFHNYTIDWTEDRIVWYVDGEVARTLESTSSQGYPQTPSRLFIGLWAGGDSSNAEGTIEWAGGLTDYSEAPFIMYVKDLVVTDYSSGTSYSYSDTSGDADSIEAKDGEVNGRYSKGVKEFDALVAGETLSGQASASESSTDSDESTSTKISSTKKHHSGSTLTTSTISGSSESGSGQTQSLAAEEKSSSETSSETTTSSHKKHSTSTSDSSTTATVSTATGGAFMNGPSSSILAGFGIIPMLLLSLL